MNSNKNRGPHSRAYATAHTPPPKPTAPDDPPPRLIKIVEMETDYFITCGLLFSDGRVLPFAAQEQWLLHYTQDGSVELPDASGEPPMVSLISDPPPSSGHFGSNSYQDLISADTAPIEQGDNHLDDNTSIEQQSLLHRNQALFGPSPDMTDGSFMDLSDSDATLSPGLFHPDPSSFSIISPAAPVEQGEDRVSCPQCDISLKNTKGLNRHLEDCHGEGKHYCPCENKKYRRLYRLRDGCRKGDNCPGNKDLRKEK